jgi:hypothetical protein
MALSKMMVMGCVPPVYGYETLSFSVVVAVAHGIKLCAGFIEPSLHAFLAGGFFSVIYLAYIPDWANAVLADTTEPWR